MRAHFFLIYGKGLLRIRVQRWEKSTMELKAVGCTSMRWIRLNHWQILAQRAVGFWVAENVES